MTSPWRIVTLIGATSAAALAFAALVRSELNDEFGTTSGRMSSAASIRSASSRSPAIRPANSLRRTATSESRSGVRNVASRIRAASVLTSAQRAASSPTSVSRALGVRPGTAFFSSDVRPSSLRLAENVVSIGETRASKATCWSAAIRIAFSEVNVYCGGTAFIAA